MIELTIHAKGAGWLVVEKPSGISVHNEPGKDLLFFAENQIQTDRKLRESVAPDPGFGIHPVHRLDRETSGVLLLACGDGAHRDLSGQFESRSVAKRYLAVVHGVFPEEERLGGWRTWNRPLTKGAGGRKDPAGRGKRVKAETRYRVMEQTPRYALIELDLLTGRKHQIRRHAKLHGHPVAGDKRYGSPRAVQYLKENHDYDRLGLHAASLTIVPPGSREPLTISSESVPDEMLRLLKEGNP